MNGDIRPQLRDAVRDAAERGSPLRVCAGNSKAFYGRPVDAPPLSVAAHRGVIDYSPTELVITARAGTPLGEVEALLAAEGQMLPFEPPHFGASATLGGTIACGLSGPRRPYAGAARDFVLGVRCLNGKGDVLSFGGQVMKNVAGYDLARALTGSLGTLAVLLEITLKVLPRPAVDLTLRRKAQPREAIALLNNWAATPLPITAGCICDGALHVRLSGTEEGVRAARSRLGGDEEPRGDELWQEIREHRHTYFAPGTPLWRFSVPPAASPIELEGEWLYDWGGAQRWYQGPEPGAILHTVAGDAGGHATLFSGGDRTGEIFQPLPPALLDLHRRLKKAFDPAGVLNPGKIYRDL
jgi:glycolate oxidase FAD binding subunit